MTSTPILSRLLVIVLSCDLVITFSARPCLEGRQHYIRDPSASRLFGISEWRDEGLARDATSTSKQDDDLIRKVPIYPVDSTQVALQGETLYFQFTADDQVRLFQQAIDRHEGVFGLGFVSAEYDILYDKISLVEIKDYNMIGDEFGIFLSAQVVGSAMILEKEVAPGDTTISDLSLDDHEDKRPMVAFCSEIMNRNEQTTLSQASEMASAVEALIVEVCNAENESRIISGEDQDRWDRYREAFHHALESDTKGYTYSQTDHQERALACSEKGSSQLFTWNELNAISWAAFSTSNCLRSDDTYRLAALDNDCLSNRLLLATYWLSDVLEDAKARAV